MMNDTVNPDKHSNLAERKKLLDQEMIRCVHLLTQHGDPEKVILFGRNGHTEFRRRRE